MLELTLSMGIYCCEVPKETVRSTKAVRVEDEGKSECRSVIERIRIERERHDPA
jgi:hypothetical protein